MVFCPATEADTTSYVLLKTESVHVDENELKNDATKYESFSARSGTYSRTEEVVPVTEVISSEALTPPKPPDGGWGWAVVFGEIFII